MKTGSLIFVPLLIIAAQAFSQATITVNVADRLKTLNGRENGINIDYLMDGGITNPSTPTSTALKNSAQMVSGRRVMLIPFVRMFRMVAM